MISIVRSVSGETGSYIARRMPLKLVYAYEHAYYQEHDIKCEPLLESGGGDDELAELLNSL